MALLSCTAVLLFLDNRDSFTFNLVGLFEELGQEVRVASARGLVLADVRALAPERIVLGPGPGRPEAAGVSVAVVRELGGSVPLLGVCLGHQAIAHAFGGAIVRASELRHGGVARVDHDGRGLFRGLASPLACGVYHSLVVERASLPPELVVTAEDEHGDVMALAHRDLPIAGVQFHPEALRSEGAGRVLANFVGDGR